MLFLSIDIIASLWCNTVTKISCTYMITDGIKIEQKCKSLKAFPFPHNPEEDKLLLQDDFHSSS